MQARVFHSPAIHPPTVYTKRAALCNFALIWAHSRSRAIHDSSNHSLHNAAQPPKHRFDIRACARYRAANNAKHAFTTDRAAYALLYVITFRCSSSPCSSFIAFCPLLRPTEHIARPIPTPFCFCPHATRQTRLSASGLPTDAYRYATPIFISHALRETYTQFRRKSPYTPAFAADTAARHPVLPLSTPLFPQAVQGSAFLCVLVSCGTCVLSFAKTSAFIEVFCSFMHIYTLRYCMFFLMRSLLPSLRSFPHCRSVSDDRASTPLSYTRFRIPPSRTRAVSSIRVCILFPRSSLSSPIFSISFHLTLAIGVTFALFACTFL